MPNKIHDDFEELPATIESARKAAKEKPGRYGGRYVARRYNRKERKTEWFVLDDDDPDVYRDDESLDVIAQVTPTAVNAIGRARHWLREDGTFKFND